MTKDELIIFIEKALIRIAQQKGTAKDCAVIELVIDLHNNVAHAFTLTKNVLQGREIPVNYLNQFEVDLTQTIQYFTYVIPVGGAAAENIKDNIKKDIENRITGIQTQLKKLEFNLNFFTKLNFFSSNIVAIGANGSGKTTLSNELKKYLPSTGVVISAQKVLIIPTFSGISNLTNTSDKLQQAQGGDKSFKVTYSTESNGNAFSVLKQLGGEFQVLLDNLLADRNVKRNVFFDTLKNGETVKDVPVTTLDVALTIWNSLIQHRTLECVDGINLTLKTSGRNTYPAHQMSDGEKVALYLIAHVLQAPNSGFVISDEPEMYLHKSILKKLWDKLEHQRPDCIFVYLTHDLDFAASRTTAKKVWIKSFIHPNIWEIEDIPHNELPESLLLELLGSRKPILFCEGKKGSIDEKIYNLLYPNYTVTPVESCFSVMTYTKIFNKIPNVTVKAFGLIDSDYHGVDRLKSLEAEKVFSIAMTEPENLFFDEKFLKSLATRLMLDETVVNLIKADCHSALEKEIELQISNYVSAKVNYYFKDSHVSKGNTLSDVNQHYSKFTSEIKIQEWYDSRKKELQEVLDTNNYQKLLAIFNNKGLKTFANKHLKISDFTDRAIKLLQSDITTQDFLRAYFPNELNNSSE